MGVERGCGQEGHYERALDLLGMAEGPQSGGGARPGLMMETWGEDTD